MRKHPRGMTRQPESKKIWQDLAQLYLLTAGNPDAKKALISLADDFQKLTRLADEDFLLPIRNRRAFNREMTKITTHPPEGGACLIMIDGDRFKRVNDEFGHQAGDDVLRFFAATLKNTMEYGHTKVYRVGGEEFGILMTGVTLDDAFEDMDTLRELIAEKEFVVSGAKATTVPPEEQRHDARLKAEATSLDPRKTISLSVSAGIAQLQPGETKEELYERADKALYAAKAQGRNRVVKADIVGAPVLSASLKL